MMNFSKIEVGILLKFVFGIRKFSFGLAFLELVLKNVKYAKKSRFLI
jgi:hypothetical protein